jgi:hypothetical protein
LPEVNYETQNGVVKKNKQPQNEMVKKKIIINKKKTPSSI